MDLHEAGFQACEGSALDPEGEHLRGEVPEPGVEFEGRRVEGEAPPDREVALDQELELPAPQPLHGGQGEVLRLPVVIRLNSCRFVLV